MPSPRPIRRHEFRSSAEPFASRGYHASGTEIERPSARSTVKVSSVTATAVAAGMLISVMEELIPRFQEPRFMLRHELLDPSNLGTAEIAATRQMQRIKPKFCHTL